MTDHPTHDELRDRLDATIRYWLNARIQAIAESPEYIGATLYVSALQLARLKLFGSRLPEEKPR